MAIQIQLRHDTTANWDDANPILAVGELGYNTTTKEFKIGDGDSTWSELEYFSGTDALTLPSSIKDTDGNDLIVFEKGGTGVARIHAVQDDLALRSARDILLYAGDDGPGKVYVGWGDANYTPEAINEIATVGYVDDAVGVATGLDGITTQSWGYPTESSKAIRPELAGEAIALKSSVSTALRWHIRENSPSVVIARLVPSAAVVTPTGEGDYFVDFTINAQDYAPTTSEHYYYVNAPESSDYTGNFYPITSTTTSLRLRYPTDPGVFNATDAEISQPSVYAQFEVNEDGAFIKIADWTDGQGGTYSQTWQFTKDGEIHFPNGYSNSRTGYGDVLRFASSVDQAIITGPAATVSTPTANRLVIAGQDGSTNGEGTDGEGGDIYVWAGQGGGTTGDGGDVKIDGGNGASSGQGGYVKIRGGDSTNGQGGFVEISAGDSYTQAGGDISITAGASNNGDGTAGGDVSIAAGYSSSSWAGGNMTLTTYSNGKITLSGAGGEFLNDSSNPDNQIATIGDVGTKAYIRVNVPTSSIGQAGDVATYVADDATYHYYCTGTYDGTTNIWKRVAWSVDTW